jgi:tetratricopeptide (TPR) repeat protein
LFRKNIKYAAAYAKYLVTLARGTTTSEFIPIPWVTGCKRISLRSDIAQIWNNRGNALRKLDRLDEAEKSLREALRLKPDFAEAQNDLGRVLLDLGRFEEAEASVRTALRLEPEHAYSHFNLGTILRHLGRASEAEASYHTALRFRPKAPGWHASLGLALLLAGKFEEGWKEYAWYWRWGLNVRLGSEAGGRFWNGEAIRDRVILLVHGTGHGDTLQFCRYAPQVAASAGRTILVVEPALRRLLSRCLA